MSPIAKRLAAVENQLGRRVAFVPRHIELLSYEDAKAKRLLAEENDEAPSDGLIRTIVLVPLRPRASEGE